MINLVKNTSEFSLNGKKWIPCKEFNIHQRINHRSSKESNYHIKLSIYNVNVNILKEAKKERYICSCLEQGIRPYGYSDDLWEKYLKEIANETHLNRRLTKIAWMQNFNNI